MKFIDPNSGKSEEKIKKLKKHQIGKSSKTFNYSAKATKPLT
jgi:hypothetical protein